MEFSFRIEGLERFDRATKEAQAAIAKEVAKALFASGKRVEAEAKKSITEGGKTGRIYKRGTVTHQASAPGEAPASDTGRLVNSINTTYEASQSSVIIRAGGGIVRYARALEFGTRHMAARPFLLPAVEKSRQWIQERLNKAIRTAIISTVKK